MENDIQSEEILKMLGSSQNIPTRMYGLLLIKPRTVTGLSLAIHSKKNELSQINRVMKRFRHYEIVTDYLIPKKELMEKDLDPRLHFWKATNLPFFYYWNKTLRLRKEDAKRPYNNYIINESDKAILNLLLDSKWFRNLLESRYSLKESQNELENIFFLNILDNVTRIISEIGAISLAYHMDGISVASYKALTDKHNFDTFVEEESKKLDTKARTEINDILKRALEYLVPKDRPYVADYYNLMMRNFAPVFIPFELSKKLANLGRIEVTLLVAFDDREYRRYNGQKQQSSRKK